MDSPLRLALVYDTISNIPALQIEVLEDFLAHHPLTELQIAVQSGAGIELREFESQFRQRVLKIRARLSSPHATPMSSPGLTGGSKTWIPAFAGMTIKEKSLAMTP